MIVVAVLAGVLVAIAIIGTIVAVDRRRKRRDDHIDYRVVQLNFGLFVPFGIDFRP